MEMKRSYIVIVLSCYLMSTALANPLYSGCFDSCMSDYSESVSDLNNFWLQEFCKVDCNRGGNGDMLSSEGVEQQQDTAESSDSVDNELQSKKNWSWYWQDSTSSEGDRSGYRKRYLEGRDKFVHFG